MSAKPLVFRCPKCGKQNLVAPERLKTAKSVPVKCWVCGTEFAYEELEKIAGGRLNEHQLDKAQTEAEKGSQEGLRKKL